MPIAAPVDHILAIEAAASRAWPPAEIEVLHGWVLRCGRAGSRRLNSVRTLAFADAGDLNEMITTAERWYRSRQLPPCFQVNDATRPPTLDLELERRGYTVRTPTSVMSSIDWMATQVDTAVTLMPHPDERVLQAILDPSLRAEIRRERLEVFARITAPHSFAMAVVDDVPVAGGLCVADGELAGLFSMRTQPAHRGRGIARAVAHRLMAWARQQRARRLYLQVEDDNAPALHLYRQLGFTRLYGYHYRETS